MNSPAPRKTQRGVVLWMLLILVAMAGGYAFYRSANSQYNRTGQDARLALSLAQAKEALIAYALLDDKRPGRLLCPDLVGDGISPLLARDDCDAYIGGLPWKTLDVRDYLDDHGTPLRLAVYRLFGGDRDTPPINSDTPTAMRVTAADGSANDDVVAAIIAPRGALDAANSDGDDNFQAGKSAADGDNDVIAVITRQELMAAVEKRVANEVRTCLEQHAIHNPQHSYPWPAALANIVRTEITYTDNSKETMVSNKGAAQSLFGMVPDTQPGNPEQALNDSITQLKITKNSLNIASTVGERKAAAEQLQAQAAYAFALYDQLFIAAVELDSRARAALDAFSKLDATLKAATKNKATYIAQSAKLPAAIEAAQPSLAAFSVALNNTGIDLFLRELQLRNQDLASRINAAVANPNPASFNALITPINAFKNSLFENSLTSNAEIENTISAAYAAAASAATAVNKARKNLNGTTAEKALASVAALYNANLLIEAAVVANRINVSGSEVDFHATRLDMAIAGYASDTASEELLAALESARIVVASLSTASSGVNAARSTTLSALDSALSALSTGNDQNQTRSSALAAVAQLTTLADALTNNGDNVALETLKSADAALVVAQSNIPAKVSEGKALRAPAQAVEYWGEIAIQHAPAIARLARRGIVGGNIAIADNENSAYHNAGKLLDSLAGDQGTLARLEKAASDNSEEAARLAADALAETRTLLDSLISAAENIDPLLPTSMAQSAVPTVWYSPACGFLRPNTSAGTWWTNNRWKTLVFYQISSSTNTAPGTLKVNAAGSHRVVALAAGRALAGQNRATSTAASFLEGVNADPTRDGEATAPVPDFTVTTPSATFNDRLAY